MPLNNSKNTSTFPLFTSLFCSHSCLSHCSCASLFLYPLSLHSSVSLWLLSSLSNSLSNTSKQMSDKTRRALLSSPGVPGIPG